jgi:Glycosyltransferase GT-D fold
MKRSHYKITPLKILKELISLNLIEVLRVILGTKFHYYNYQESLKEITKGKSLIRWGDGETALARGKDIWFQSSQPTISLTLNSFWSLRNGNVIFSLPRVMIDGNIFQYLKRRHDFWKEFSSRIYFSKRANLLAHKKFGDSHLWYQNSELFIRDLENFLKSRSILLVASESKIFQNLVSYQFDVQFLQIPERDFFLEMKEVEEKLIEWTKLPRRKEAVVLLAAGPIGKMLAFNNAEKVQFIDVGHGFLLNLGEEIIMFKE